MKKLALVPVFCLTMIITACATVTPLNPEAQNVKLTMSPIPRDCQFKGTVTATTQHIRSESHKVVKQSEMNILRNQAAQLGANVVFVTTHRAVYKDHYVISNGDNMSELDNHIMTGRAYQCSPKTMERFSISNSQFSDF